MTIVLTPIIHFKSIQIWMGPEMNVTMTMIMTESLTTQAMIAPEAVWNWTSDSTTDFDNDGCRDSTEDTDDDNDGVEDEDDGCLSSYTLQEIGGLQIHQMTSMVMVAEMLTKIQMMMEMGLTMLKTIVTRCQYFRPRFYTGC